MRKVNLGGNMYDLLSRGDNALVVALDSVRAAKVFELGSLTLMEEARLLKAANRVNDLLVGYLGTEIVSDSSQELLVMERVYAVQPRALTEKLRVQMVEEFKRKLVELHRAGFAHWDIKRPLNAATGNLWDNIIPTLEGIKLIDCGISVTADHPEFDEAKEHDLESCLEFAEMFTLL